MRKCNTRWCWLKYTSGLTLMVWNVIKIESRHINRVRLICINTPCQKCAFNPWDARGFRKVNKLPHLGRDGGERREEAERAHLMQIQKSTYSNGHIYPEHLLFWPHLHNPYEVKNPYILGEKWFWTLESHLKMHDCHSMRNKISNQIASETWSFSQARLFLVDVWSEQCFY